MKKKKKEEEEVNELSAFDQKYNIVLVIRLMDYLVYFSNCQMK